MISILLLLTLFMVYNAPCFVSAQNAYMLFYTSGFYLGDGVKDTVCVSEATSQGLISPSTAKALVANHVAGWNDAYSVFGPTMIYIGSALNIRTGGPLTTQISSAVPGCTFWAWTGFYINSFVTELACNGWTAYDSASSSAAWPCSEVKFNNYAAGFQCDNSLQFLCYNPITGPTFGPTLPTRSPSLNCL